MKRFLCYAILIVCVFNVSAQNKESLLDIPSFMKDTHLQMGKNIQFCVKSDFFKIISCSAPVEAEHISKKRYGESEINLKNIWKSEILILNNLNEVIFKKQYPCHIWVDTIENNNKSLFMITKTKVVGNELFPFEIQLLSNEGEVIKKIEKIKGNTVIKSIKNDCLVFNNMEIDYSRIFNFMPLMDFVGYSKNKKVVKKTGNRKVEFQKPPTGFIMIGGRDLEYIVSFNRVLWRTAFETPGQYSWKIDDIGEDIQQIYYLGFNYLGVETTSSFIILSMDTGSEVISFNRMGDFVKENKVIWKNTKFDKSKLFINTATNTKFEISKNDLIKNKTTDGIFAKIIKKQTPKNTMNCIENEIGEKTFLLIVENDKLRIDEKSKKGIYKIENNKIPLSNLIN